MKLSMNYENFSSRWRITSKFEEHWQCGWKQILLNTAIIGTVLGAVILGLRKAWHYCTGSPNTSFFINPPTESMDIIHHIEDNLTKLEKNLEHKPSHGTLFWIISGRHFHGEKGIFSAFD